MYNVTPHGTNGIIIQKCLQTTNNDININPPVKNVRRRSFKPVSNELQPCIKTKGRLNPVAIPIVDTGVNQLNGFSSKCKDLVWLILCYESSTDQIFPGWKGFFYEVEHQAIDKRTVAYLPTINKSPTKIDTIQEVLCQLRRRQKPSI